jgi:phage baseplate assembly protein V
VSTHRFNRPRAQTTDKRFFGVVEAVVVDVVDPDKEGRVKIQFPWFDDEMVTEFCRVRQLYAGNGYGTFFVPEIGDEVLVSFVHGDMRMPIILGGLYNGKDKPPSDRQKDKDEKMIRTKAGHALIFDDHLKKVTLKSNAGNTLELDDQAKKVTLESNSGHTLELDDQAKKVTLKTSSGQTVVLDGSSSMITIEATNVAVKATSVAIQSGHVELGNAAAEPVILGTTFAAYFAAHVHTTTIPGFPTTPPTVPMPPNALSTKVMAG